MAPPPGGKVPKTLYNCGFVRGHRVRSHRAHNSMQIATVTQFQNKLTEKGATRGMPDARPYYRSFAACMRRESVHL